MKLTNQIIVNSIQGIQDFSTKELPYKVTLQVSKNINILDNILEDYNKEYQKLAEEYLEKNAEGGFIPSEDNPNSFLIKKGKEQEYLDKLNTLLNFENEVDLYMIKSTDLEDIKISAKTLMSIHFMIEDED